MSNAACRLQDLCRAMAQAFANGDTRRQVLRFCCVGAANVLVDFCVYSLALGLGLPLYASRSGAWVIACLFSYLVNRAWTFKAADNGFWPIVRFFAVNAFSLCLAVIVLYIFTGLGLSERLAFFLSLPFTMTSNFLGYKLWTFKKVAQER